ncbi:MAG: CDP-alcohol phosphatidyltransferase family protein [Bacilli bacterium]|jgi:phosphatidylglycerophosphate synthase
MSIKKHIPNILSTIRFFMALGLPFVFLNTSVLTTFFYYIAGESTDFVDGFLARKWNVQSKFGKIVDPVSDKMLNVIALFLTALFANPLLFISIGFEASIAAISIKHAKIYKDETNSKPKGLTEKIISSFETASKLSVSQIGKYKTWFLAASTSLSLLATIIPELSLVSNLILISTIGMQVATTNEYLNQYNKALKEKELENVSSMFVDKEEDKEINNLKTLKNKLTFLSNKKKKKVNNKGTFKQLEEFNNQEQKDMGISRTLKK